MFSFYILTYTTCAQDLILIARKSIKMFNDIIRIFLISFFSFILIFIFKHTLPKLLKLLGLQFLMFIRFQ